MMMIRRAGSARRRLSGGRPAAAPRGTIPRSADGRRTPPARRARLTLWLTGRAVLPRPSHGSRAVLPGSLSLRSSRRDPPGGRPQCGQLNVLR
eukprot:538702-Hanusia_phi.AAC.2